MLLFLRPRRLISLAVLAALVAGGWWAWHRVTTSGAVSQSTALQDFRAARTTGVTRLPGTPRPGVYTYLQTGDERVGAGPLSLTRTLPDRARYTVVLTPGGYREELALSADHIEAVRLQLTAGDWKAVWRRTKVDVLGVGRDDRRDLRPAPLHLPADLTVGHRWSGHYLAGTLPISYRARVLRSASVAVGGRSFATRVIRTVSDTGGAHPGVRTDTVWWSSALSLPLRWDIEMTVGGLVDLRTTDSLTLLGTTPAT